MRKLCECLWNRAHYILGLIAVCAIPFFIVGLLFADDLSFWRMALAYAIAVCSRPGFKLAFNVTVGDRPHGTIVKDLFACCCRFARQICRGVICLRR